MEDPENFDFGAGTVEASYIYGAVYGIYPHQNFHYIDMMPPAQSAMYVTSRETVLMIPGKYTCPQNWVREYYGYLMAERYSHKGRSTF